MRRASLRGFLQSDLRLVIIYALILLVIGVFFLFKHSGLSGDSIYYVDTARNIALGNGFIYHVASYLAYPLARPLDIAMPLYPTLVSLFIKMGLDATLSARLIPLIFLTLIPFPMYYLTRNLYGRAIAHVATIVLVFLWALAYVGSYTWTETAFIFFILLSMLFLSRLFTSPQEPVWGGDRVTLLITGVFIGLAYLIKGNGLLLLPVAFLVIFLLLTPVRDKIKYKTGLFLLLLLGFMLVSSPWLIRNYLVFGNPLHHGLLHIIQAPTADKPLRFLLVFGTALFPLVLCLPYALRYLFDQSERKKLLFLAAFPVIMVLFFTMWDLIIHRLMTPSFPFLIIIGVKALFV